MAVLKLQFLLLPFLFALIFTQIRADDGATVGSDAFQIELDKLSSKIQSLESIVDKKSEELRSKDEVIAEKENAIAEKEKSIKEKSDSITSLKSEVASLEVQGSSDVKEHVQKAHSRSQELEKEVEKLQMELDLKASLREALETRSKELEKKTQEINPKLENLQQTVEKQKTKLRKTERALKIAEEELVKTKDEAAQKINELSGVHSAWLPPWLAAQFSSSLSYVEALWIEHGLPALEKFTQKALEKKAQAEKWAQPHIKTIKTKWVPATKKQLVIMIANIEPHWQLATEKTKYFYAQSKVVLNPHFQVAKKFCKPYIDQVAVATKPHVESATNYHNQVQSTLKESLKKHNVTKPLATEEFVWIAASALFALPVIILFKTLSALFFGTTKKHVRNSKVSHSRRKAKRHSDK